MAKALFQRHHRRLQFVSSALGASRPTLAGALAHTICAATNGPIVACNTTLPSPHKTVLGAIDQATEDNRLVTIQTWAR
jgi:hypothetical protein